MKYILTIAAFVFVLGCAQQTENKAQNLNLPVTGEWSKPVEGQPGNTDGMILNEDGSVTTINMATLTYKRWTKEGDTLTLTGLSEGNGSSSDFKLTFKIKELTPERMVLTLDDAEFVYSKVK